MIHELFFPVTFFCSVGIRQEMRVIDRRVEYRERIVEKKEEERTSIIKLTKLNLPSASFRENATASNTYTRKKKTHTTRKSLPV